jgi:hypothetical protein
MSEEYSVGYNEGYQTGRNEAIDELEQENRLLRARNNRLEAESQKLRENSCRFPLCQTEEYQKDLAEQIKRELYTGSQRTHQWVDLTDKQIESIFIDAGWSWGEKADMYLPAVRQVLKLFKEVNE